MDTSYSFLYKVSSRSSLASAMIVHWPSLYSLTKHARFWGCDLFPTPSFICLLENYSKTIGRKLVRFSSVKDVDFIQCNLKSVSIFSYYYFLGEKHIESTMLCYSLVKHERFCEPGVVTFSRRSI